MECLEYFVQNSKRTFILDLIEFTGQADMYVLTAEAASSPNDPRIYFTDSHGPKRTLYLDQAIRQWFGWTTGTYYFCFYASTPYAAKLIPSEKEIAEGIYLLADGSLASFPVAGGKSIKSRLTGVNLN